MKLLLLINERKFAEGAIETLRRRESEYLKKKNATTCR